MNNLTATIVVVGLVVLALLGFFSVYGFRGKFKLWGPFGVRAQAEGANEPSPGIRAKDVIAKKGDVDAHDESGQGVDVERIRAGASVHLSSKGPRDSGSPKG